jgi:hypothetical protein
VRVAVGDTHLCFDVEGMGLGVFRDRPQEALGAIRELIVAS